MNEIWRDIIGYEGLYMVSDFGNVKSVVRKVRNCRWGINTIKVLQGTKLKQAKFNSGYFFVGLCKDGKIKQFMVHRLVAITFLSNTSNKRTVNHINGNKEDNRLINLEWATFKENFHHATATGLIKNVGGENKYAKKITISKDGTTLTFDTQRQAARFIGCHESNVCGAKQKGYKCNGFTIKQFI